MAETCSSGAQSQFSPFCAHTPWPYCVIFPAIHAALGKALMMSHTSCVLPMLRVWPPITITRHGEAVFTSLPFQLLFQMFDARRQFRNARLPREEVFEFLQWPGRRTPNGLAAANDFAAQNAGLPANDGAIFEMALF